MFFQLAMDKHIGQANHSSAVMLAVDIKRTYKSLSKVATHAHLQRLYQALGVSRGTPRFTEMMENTRKRFPHGMTLEDFHNEAESFVPTLDRKRGKGTITIRDTHSLRCTPHHVKLPQSTAETAVGTAMHRYHSHATTSVIKIPIPVHLPKKDPSACAQYCSHRRVFPPTHVEMEAELHEAFNVYDRDNSGHINAVELMTMLSTAGSLMTEEQAQRVIDVFDRDGDGHIDFDEFCEILDAGIVSWRFRTGYRVIFAMGGPGSGA
ncbi:hypothetical protein SARC_01245 [Sphaeroforma arctica JP610]|uniref:EF-hand domain-containing protein n=1 Tax=Sphaeroforma arctica JP610 TaxID=667725 RepID=A0A0L0GCL1_9EUKA|nr:hypothetical protein SARC_01245 [Sphaeroforma arctica JP610]KNC86616.1 hypothetical protein SARC_01245 [Sphaeroforma arctica JP610]|eukprot:XP_014160518.1 hypothetical protein SARC_01245 [Sphaeroforma arctica JP610]